MIIYLNGEFLPEEKAKISPFDHGFLYGDGVFETMVVTNGLVFKLDQHLERLYDSLTVLKIKIPFSKNKLKKLVLETLRRNSLKDGYVRLIVSRGVGYPALDPRACEKPTIVIIPSAKIFPQSFRRSYSDIIDKVVIVSTRKIPSVCIEARVKSLNYLNNILARIEALESGADEAIMLDLNGFVTEGPGENIFIVRSGSLHTPPPHNILNGITRQTVLELAESMGIKVYEQNLTRYDLYTADEAFFTSTFGGIKPIREIDGRRIGLKAPGPITEKLRNAYKSLLLKEGTPIG